MAEVVGTSETGIGVFGQSQGGDGVQGRTKERNHSGGGFVNEGGGQGVFGSGSPGVKGVSATGDGVQGFTSERNHSGGGFVNEGGGQGVFGSGSPGVKGQSDTGDGVLGVSKGRGFSGVTGINEGGGRGLTAVGSPAGHFDGDVEVTGDIRLVNQDVAEDFDVQDVAGIEPGAVMVFDTDGKLRPCRQPYDKKVAGVIAGAGDFKPAIVLGKLPSAQGRLPIALVGKVYCRIDAQYGHVEVGDLLTTSSTPGYAMKATDPTKAFGAVIGKALRAIDTGQALIPILIALQ